MPLLVLPLESLVETVLHLSVCGFPPCHVQVFSHPLAMIFVDSKLPDYFKLLKYSSTDLKIQP